MKASKNQTVVLNARVADTDKKSIKSAFLLALANYLVVVAIVLLSVYTAIMQPGFLSATNLQNIGRQMAALGMTSLGMMVVVLGGYIDLSVAGIFSISAMMMAKFTSMTNTWLALLLGLAVGITCGLINGSLMVGFGARNRSDCLYITYGMSTVFVAICLLIDARTINIGNDPILDMFARNSIGPFPVTFIIFAVLVVIMHFFLRHTTTGRSIFLMGGNYEVARLGGINVKRLLVLMYTFTGALTALASMLQAGRVTTINAKVGTNYETNSLMAVVIGGTAFSGGRGGAINTFFGVLLVTLMNNSLNLLGADSNLQFAIKGAIMVTVVFLDSWKERLEGVA